MLLWNEQHEGEKLVANFIFIKAVIFAGKIQLTVSIKVFFYEISIPTFGDLR